MPGLPELQRLFWRAVADAAPTPALLALVESTPGLDAAARLGIYANAYLWRITDALREDFPRLAARLGDDAFAGLVRAYLARHPSEHPSIAHVGRRLAAFLATDAESALAAPPWAADLARLEWARRSVFEAPDAAILEVGDLRGVPPEAWGGLDLRPIPASTMLVTAWPVHVLWRDDEAPAEALVPARTAYRIWRDGFVVHHAVMDTAEEAALACLAAGAALAEACERLETPEEAGGLLLRWIEDRLLARPGGLTGPGAAP